MAKQSLGFSVIIHTAFTSNTATDISQLSGPTRYKYVATCDKQPIAKCNKPVVTCDKTVEILYKPVLTCNNPLATWDRAVDTCYEPANRQAFNY